MNLPSPTDKIKRILHLDNPDFVRLRNKEGFVYEIELSPIIPELKGASEDDYCVRFKFINPQGNCTIKLVAGTYGYCVQTFKTVKQNRYENGYFLDSVFKRE